MSVTMTAGRRDKRVQVLKRVETRGSAGDVLTTYVPRCKVWGEVLARTGRERISAQQEVAAWDVKVRVLFNPAITHTDKIVLNSVRYDVVHLAELGRQEGLEILAARDLQ